LPAEAGVLRCRVMLEIETFELPPIGTNAYLVRHPESGEALVVDAPLHAWSTVEARLRATGSRLVAVLMTHGHWDHMLDGAAFNEADVPTYGHEDDARFFADPASMSLFLPPGLPIRPMKIDHWVSAGETLELLGTRFEARHVPGHCPGSLLFWCEAEGVAFVGDAIFAGSIGRTDLPLGSFSTLERSIRKQIYTLPAATVLYPGHGPRTTVEREAATNPFVRPA
jgi:hydroxyacylglutathione hydrolase